MNKKKIIINNYELDNEQLKPVLENAKYSLIIAGAGAGKTLTLLGKIKYLLEEKHVLPKEICCISFTNETVNNLTKNIYKNCQKNVPCFTFHKLGLSILDKQNYEYTITSDNLKTETIKSFFQKDYLQNKFIKKQVYKYFHIHGLKKDKKLQAKNISQTIKLITTFLNLFSANNFTQKDFSKFFTTKNNKHLLYIIYTIYIIYEQRKKESGEIDFDDMIKIATKIVAKHPNFLPFKYIIIDEFQDTSYLRFSLIKEIINKTNASLCVVGDDYQSIYHFSGCNLNLFLNFQNYFPETKIYKLETTYRNSQELINLAGKFIMKNNNQIKKNLKSNQSYHKPVKIVYYKKRLGLLEKIIKKIPPGEDILILGRNNFDLKKYTNKEYKDSRIRYLTIHKSKGLEGKHVILLNATNDTYGLPSQQKDAKILNLVKQEQPYPYEEERRLFYVALTRTKTDIYILTPKEKPSIFIKEIQKEKEVEIINL